MANIDNKCKDLTVRDYFSENGYNDSKNSLEDLYSLQAKTQSMYFEKQGKKPFSEYSIGDVVDFLMVTNHAIIDELHEMMDAVGGIEDGKGDGLHAQVFDCADVVQRLHQRQDNTRSNGGAEQRQ